MNIKDNYFQNPILQGFYPDPSICRVNDDYYLVNSSFAFFPGVPIFHSKDLVNWNQIGHVLDRHSQLDLDGSGYSGGIFAPTIRYNNGIFYVITTNMTTGGNFIVTATNPQGPWSDPYWIENAQGIDPSLFFDDDGKVYYTGTRHKPKDISKYFGDHEIWIQELCLESMTLVGESYGVWDGALKKSMFPEGPHLYKMNGYYYLMIAEGGTDHYHSITIARSKEIFGEYEANPANPILTHRHLGSKYSIANVGHGDLIETENKEWYMVLLGSRVFNGRKNLARETFLAPVEWENDWPIISPGTGKVEFSYPYPNLPKSEISKNNLRDDFEKETLDYCWNFIRTPRENFFNLTERNSFLRLKLGKKSMIDQLKLPSFEWSKLNLNKEFTNDSPSFVGRRVQHKDFDVITKMEFTPNTENESAGIAVVQNDNHQFRLESSIENGEHIIRLIVCTSKTQMNFMQKTFTYENFENIMESTKFNSKTIYLKVSVRDNKYSFYYGEQEKNLNLLVENLSANFLCSEIAGGFVGAYIGMFASSNGIESTNYADFDWFEYIPKV